MSSSLVHSDTGLMLSPCSYISCFSKESRQSAGWSEVAFSRRLAINFQCACERQEAEVEAQSWLQGLWVVQAPGEAEATCAALNRGGYVDACVTNDSDVLLFGAETVFHTLRPLVIPICAMTSFPPFKSV